MHLIPSLIQPINLLIYSYKIQKSSIKIDKKTLMMFFQPELGSSVLDLLGRSTGFGRWAPLQKQETKRIGGGSPVSAPMPKSILSCGRKYQLLRE